MTKELELVARVTASDCQWQFFRAGGKGDHVLNDNDLTHWRIEIGEGKNWREL